MPGNNRVFYAIHSVGFAPHLSVAPSGGPSGFLTASGVQSVGITTTFNLEQAFELGQLEIYENIEGIPDVEVTLNRVLDGTALAYHLATQTGNASSSLVGRSNSRSYVALNIYSDTNDNATGTPLTSVGMSGMYPSALTYTLNVEGNCTEDITLVGNDKIWTSGGFSDVGTDPFLPAFDGTSSPPGSGGVQRREDVLMGAGAGGSTWPTEIPGINGAGKNLENGASGFMAHIQTCTISADLGRTELFELGRRGPYHRYVDFPLEVTCAIETTTSEGDLIDALADPVGGTNLTDQTISIIMREGTRFDLGASNKLASITYGGGDAGVGGGNVTVTYSYSNFNSLTVTSPADPAGL